MENASKRSKSDESKLINSKTIDGVRVAIENLHTQNCEVKILVKKSKARQEEYLAKIVGVYPSFFTVEDSKLNIAFSLQYIDILTGSIKISN